MLETQKTKTTHVKICCANLCQQYQNIITMLLDSKRGFNCDNEI